MPTTKPPSNTARRALEAAAERPTLSVLPLPPDVPVRGAVRQRLLSGLLGAGLLEEIPTTDAASTWRTDETGRDVALRLSKRGLAAIGRTLPAAQEKGRTRRTRATTRGLAEVLPSSPPAKLETVLNGSGEVLAPAARDQAAERHPGGKLGDVLTALLSDAGATLSELVTLTGWQPHTTRAALTRLRQRGYALERAEADGRKAYRIGGVR